MAHRRTVRNSTATQQNIADEVGCSRNTVSLALRDSPRISPEVRARIQHAAASLGYIPNYAARHLSTRRSGLIGVYTSGLKDAVRTELVNQLVSRLHTAEYRPVLGLGHEDTGPWHTSPWMNTFQALHVEAIVIVNEAMDTLPAWHRTIPTVFVGCHPRKRAACDYVALDRAEGAARGIQHLLSRGHRDILVACSVQSPFGQGCVEALHRAGRTPLCLDVDPRGQQPMTSLIDHALTGDKRPTAALFGDAPLAARMLHHLQQRGVRIPDDLAAVAYDYFPWADLLYVPLSTIEQPLARLAHRAVDVIQRRLTTRDTPWVQEVLPHELHIRASG